MKAKRTLYITNPLTGLQLDWEDPSRLLDQLSLQSNEGMEEYGWVKVGSATVDFTIERRFERIISDCIHSAEKKVKELDAEFHRKRMEYTAQIDKMRALGWSGKEGS